MKYIYAILAVMLIAGLYLWFTSGVSEAPTPATNNESQVTEPETDTVEEVAPTPNPADNDPEASAAVEVEATADEQAVSSDVAAGTERVFNVDSFNYGYSEERIVVQEGDTVTINLTSSDGFHDWVVDEFNAATEKIMAGDTTSVTFVADEAGEFEFYCSVGSHRQLGMVGTLVVEAR